MFQFAASIEGLRGWGRALRRFVGMVSNGFSIADPDDAGMLDVVGFDAATPVVIADFIRQD